MAAFMLTIFLGSFLLFQVQPLIGRYILPWFGGSPAVWTTCMVFFQVMLLAGYGYAHAVTAAGRRKQGYIHACLLAAALLFLPIGPSPAWKPNPGEEPIGKILLLLLSNIGVPYLILSATAPLVQHWFVRSFPGKSPYRLYSLSNAASFLALVTYPFLVEPNLTLKHQVWAWSCGFALFVLLCGWCALTGGDHLEPGYLEKEPTERGTEGLTSRSVLLWLLLSACGSAALLATTNQICQEVAVVPFLWVAPLALYLVSFTVCFNSDRAYHRGWWVIIFLVMLIPAFRVLHLGVKASLPAQVLVFLLTLLACCMACHGELARSRPGSRHLTSYYLIMATGGALGGTFVAIGAPLFFKGYWEFPIAMTLSLFAVALAMRHDGALNRETPWRAAGIAVGLVVFATLTARYIHEVDRWTVARSRDFYGVLRVMRSWDRMGQYLYLMNGRVVHGSQYTDSELERLPTTYYGPQSAAGLALTYHPRRLSPVPSQRGIRVGVVGLGAGTLAAYGQQGDTFRFYEINGEVTRIADRYFSFRRNSAAQVETVTGDARMLLESESKRRMPQHFDVLLVDAFSSDSIPVHLLTRECFELYRYHLNQDGLLLVHVTNRFLDLIPIVSAQAERMGVKAVLVRSPKAEEKGVSAADWMVLTSNGEFLNRLRMLSDHVSEPKREAAAPLWTDDFVSLWHILKWKAEERK